MLELVVMVGVQGSGKSTLVQGRLAATHEVVSKDHWPNARRREQRQQRVVREFLMAGKAVVVDNTNPSSEDRAPLVDIARELGVPVRAIFVDTPQAVALARNRARAGRALVPDAGFFATLRRLIPPTTAEGFDSVEVVGGEDGADG